MIFFKVLDIFLVFSKIGGEGITPGTRGVLAEYPEWSPGEGFRARGASGECPGCSPGVGFRDTWLTRKRSRGCSLG